MSGLFRVRCSRKWCCRAESARQARRLCAPRRQGRFRLQFRLSWRSSSACIRSITYSWPGREALCPIPQAFAILGPTNTGSPLDTFHREPGCDRSAGRGDTASASLPEPESFHSRPPPAISWSTRLTLRGSRPFSISSMAISGGGSGLREQSQQSENSERARGEHPAGYLDFSPLSLHH